MSNLYNFFLQDQERWNLEYSIEKSWIAKKKNSPTLSKTPISAHQCFFELFFSKSKIQDVQKMSFEPVY